MLGAILPMPLSHALLCALVLSPLAACSQGVHNVSLPSFRDVTDAPPAIQTAAQAVVRVGTANSFATGSFISPHGLLLTNNHVLGVDVCPREGCYAKITRMLQRHSTPPKTQTVYVVPLAVDVGLDMALVQVLDGSPGGSVLDTPQYLTIDARDPPALQGSSIHIVGHPEGHLKKWSTGSVVDSSGAWISTTAFTLPGNSGSPILDDAGHLVGLLHRGPAAQDLVTNDGINEFSIGTASAALVPALSAPLPAAIRSISASVTDADVAQHDLVYLNARASMVTVDGMPKSVLAILGAACDGGLARTSFESPEDLSSAVAPCSAASLWIDCRRDAPADFSVCPDQPPDWQRRCQSVYDRWRSLNGQLELSFVSSCRAALASSQADGMSAGAQGLEQALAAAKPPLDFGIANSLAKFHVDSYAGTRIVDFLHAYASFPDYALSGTEIASAALWLNGADALSRTDTISLLKALYSDDKIELGTRLYIEEILYVSAALD
jgi:hypothetical protein